MRRCVNLEGLTATRKRGFTPDGSDEAPPYGHRIWTASPIGGDEEDAITPLSSLSVSATYSKGSTHLLTSLT